jgi:hypothetical protein
MDSHGARHERLVATLAFFHPALRWAQPSDGILMRESPSRADRPHGDFLNTADFIPTETSSPPGLAERIRATRACRAATLFDRRGGAR